MSSAYHLQSDELTRLNELINALRTTFASFMPVTLIGLSGFIWLSIGITLVTPQLWQIHHLFEGLYGHQPQHFGIDPDQDCVIPELDKWLRQTITALLQQ